MLTFSGGRGGLIFFESVPEFANETVGLTAWIIGGYRMDKRWLLLQVKEGRIRDVAQTMSAWPARR
jgi:hypothetical protein